MTISQRLFALLDDNKKSQKELAIALGISDRNISAWKARGSDPPANLIPAIADFFGVSVEYLFTGVEKNSAHTYHNSVSGGTVMQMQGECNSGTLMVNGDKQIQLSAETLELIRVFDSLNVRNRLKILTFAYEVEEGAKK